MVKRLLRWVGVVAVLAVITGVGFSLYAHFLVDYSLENLELALASTQNESGSGSALKQNLYSGVVNDLLMEEAAEEDLDFKNLILLDLASKSLSGLNQKSNQDRAQLYLRHVVENKLPARSIILRMSDTLYHAISYLYRSFFSLGQYFRKVFSNPQEKPLQISSMLLLNEAQEKEKLWQLDEAAQFYQRYLELYPNRSDRAVVTVSLSQVLIKQKKWNSAEKLLRGVQLAYAGTDEAMVASSLLKKIDSLRKRQPLIDRYRRLAETEGDAAKRQEIQFKLALEYLFSYSIDNAEELFKQVQDSKDNTLRQKSKFYLGWIYKLRSQYDLSAGMLEKLENEPMLNPEMEIGLDAQLAHIYTEKNDSHSIIYYQKVSDKAQASSARDRAVWRSVAALEQAKLYYLTAKEVEDADKEVESVRNFLPANIQDSLLKNIKEASFSASRDRAFEYLLSPDFEKALPLFERVFKQNPKDAWAQSGMAAVYLLKKDKERAREIAEQAYKTRMDEYTASMLAYVHSLLGEDEQAAVYYENALKHNPDYIAARFNLAYSDLRLEHYDKALKRLRELDQSFGTVKNTMRSKILNNMGYALWRLGERSQAEKQFREAVAITPDLAEAKINLDKISAGLIPEQASAPQPISPKE